MSLRHMTSAAVVVCLGLCAGSVDAGSITYDFDWTTGTGTNPAVAILVIDSPPASLTGNWSAGKSDIVSLSILYGAFAPPGDYTPITGATVIGTGTKLDYVSLTADPDGGLSVTINQGINSNTATLSATNGHFLYGNLVLASATVPEPSSLVLAGTAALAGLGLWSRQRIRR